MKTPSRADGKARKMYGTPPKGADSLKLYSFSIVTRPDEKPYAVLELSESADAERVELAYSAAMQACRDSSPGYVMSSRECLDVARAVLLAIGALSTGVKK